MDWVLIIALFTPGGDFVSKDTQLFRTQAECVSAKEQVNSRVDFMGLRYKGLCVTKDHWEGKKQMPGVAYD